MDIATTLLFLVAQPMNMGFRTSSACDPPGSSVRMGAPVGLATHHYGGYEWPSQEMLVV